LISKIQWSSILGQAHFLLGIVLFTKSQKRVTFPWIRVLSALKPLLREMWSGCTPNWEGMAKKTGRYVSLLTPFLMKNFIGWIRNF